MPDGEDLRIDATGTVHPLGRRASQELRARAGEWRLLGSPSEVVFAMRTGQGSRSVRLAGEVRVPGALCDVVATIAQGSWSGELVVLDEAATRSVFFDRGNVIATNTSLPAERLGEILWRFGAITRGQLEEVLREAEKTGKRIGETAIDLEFVAPEELFQMMARQVEEVFYAAVHVERGTFFLFDTFDESRVVRREHLSAGALLMEAARRMDELRFFREKVPSDAWVPAPLPAAAGKKPPPELVEVLGQCDARRSVAEIGRRIGQLEFEVTRAIFQLAGAGFVSVNPPRPEGAPAIVLAFNTALQEIHRACDRAGKGTELRTGVDQFATSTGVFVPLFDGAGPLEDGTLRGERIARNVAALAGEDDADGWLVQQLFEYTGFALFHAGSLLPRADEASLNARVAEMLKPLRAIVEGGPASRRPPPASSRPRG
jgi:hypothetical protein